MKNLLLISNSASPGESYLEVALPDIAEILKDVDERIIFIPYAAVSYSFDAYEDKLNRALATIGKLAESIHKSSNPVSAIRNAEAVIIGGGNTWQLLDLMQKNQLLDPIRERIDSGVPYVGWSAGSNVACPTIKTTNDMPIIIPQRIESLNLVPFQINAHYLDIHPEGHGGETREDRIQEYIIANPDTYVLGLREGSRLRLKGGRLTLLGKKSARLFKNGIAPSEYSQGTDLTDILLM